MLASSLIHKAIVWMANTNWHGNIASHGKSSSTNGKLKVNQFWISAHTIIAMVTMGGTGARYLLHMLAQGGHQNGEMPIAERVLEVRLAG
jgi:hypothetical protein